MQQVSSVHGGVGDTQLGSLVDGPAPRTLCPRLVQHVVEDVPLGRCVVLLAENVCRDLIILHFLLIIALVVVVVVAKYHRCVATVIGIGLLKTIKR